MGWRGVPGLSWVVGPMPALADCFVSITVLVWQPDPELLGWQR